MLGSDSPATWRDWRPRLAGTNRETGEPCYQQEFVPVRGTRSEFVAFFIEKLMVWSSHKWRHRWCKQGGLLVEHHKNNTSARRPCLDDIFYVEPF